MIQNLTGMECIFGQTGIDMKVNGYLIKEMGKVSTHVLMGIDMSENLEMINIMEKVY